MIEETAEDVDCWFIGLYDGHRGLVFSTALRLSGSWTDAEDLTAEAFLRAYRAIIDYDRDRRDALQPRAWLMTILLNLWRNRLRTAARKPPPGPLENAAFEVADPRESVAQAVERHETSGELGVLLSRLPENQRVAVVLRHVGDLPIGEIAVILGVPEGTVKSYVSRGLKRLRELSQGGAVNV